ncbi:MAG: TolC family protein [Verrucomicrobiaceae bacterium]|nr:TolC family protein [Verrucomicrobiaceae bacterium]
MVFPSLSRPFRSAALLAVVCVAVCSCTGAKYRSWADKEVFSLLKKKTSKVPNSGQHLMDITPPPPANMAKLTKNSKTVDFLGERANVEKDARVISLADALDFAVHRNRGYLLQKEVVYLAALDLTLTRQNYTPIFSGGGASTLDRSKVTNGVNTLVNTGTLTTSGDFGLGMLTRTGARLAADLTTDFVRFITGGLDSGNSRLAFTLTQPLLRGGGYLAASEALTQGERSVLYAIRAFTQQRKAFAVDVATQYFRAIQSRETAKNAHLGFLSFNNTVERQKTMIANGQGTYSSLGQLLQAQLNFERIWINAIRNYEQQLDDLKITLGLPVTERIVLNYKDLDSLQILPPPGTLDEALQTALTTRLDLWNQRDRVEDTTRKILIAKQDTLPGLNIIASQRTLDDPNRNDFQLQTGNRGATVGLTSDFNLNLKPERNNLRAAMIAEQRARRELELAEEQIRNDVRTRWRDLEVARKQYEFALKGMEISQRRLQAEEEFTAVGQGTARDLVEAQRDINTSRDLMVSTRINHNLARLQLWRDMGVLFIEKDGSWVDVLKREKPKGK